MTKQERTNKMIKATKLAVSMTFNKAVWYQDENTPSDYMNRKSAYAYLENVNDAFIKIENTQRVVNSVVKKIKSMGFSIDVIENNVTDFGKVYYWFTIHK